MKPEAHRRMRRFALGPRKVNLSLNVRIIVAVASSRFSMHPLIHGRKRTGRKQTAVTGPETLPWLHVNTAGTSGSMFSVPETLR